ncbi:MAG TPA: hypothetical protein VK760_00785 [Candidatus Acidoferrales bacterium]|jgi:hypothetical protein|nr:hypothetical protein [Candidatus Acidoferrales bacterium]
MERRTAVVLAAFTLLAVAPQSPPGDSPVIAAAYARNESLKNYTFEVNVAMAMRHFPWLHFHIQGDGVYDRGRRYVVHFTKMPFFAPQPRDVDLSMLDPAMWPQLYTVASATTDGSDAIFTLHAIDDDSLQEARVTMSPIDGTERVEATYRDGTHIAMTVASKDSDGYLLPAKITASIDYGRTPLSADADFTNYVVP